MFSDTVDWKGPKEKKTFPATVKTQIVICKEKNALQKNCCNIYFVSGVFMMINGLNIQNLQVLSMEKGFQHETHGSQFLRPPAWTTCKGIY